MAAIGDDRHWSGLELRSKRVEGRLRGIQASRQARAAAVRQAAERLAKFV